MKVCLTVDMEHDCPPYLSTYRGIEEGAPRLLQLFAEEQIAATFFTTGDVARRYPDTVKEILSGGHELGCHGDTHVPFDTIDAATAETEIQRSTSSLARFAPVVSFRAPNLRFPEAYLPLLEQAGYLLDSSQAKYKSDFWFGRKTGKLRRVPASVTSSVLRLPKWIRYPWLSMLSDPVVLFVHPWEFVDFRGSALRLDCRFRTGLQALEDLKSNIRYLKRKKGEFHRMKDLLAKAA